MQLRSFIKYLQRIEKKHGGRMRVVADTRALLTSCNSAWEAVDVGVLKVERVNQCDGDGFTIENRDGTERQALCLVLKA